MSAVADNAFARHFRHYVRFYGAVLVGVAVWLATPAFSAAVRLLLAGDAFFATYIVTMGLLSMRSRHETFLERVRRQDTGVVVIALITAVTVVVILGSVFALLNLPDRPPAILFTLSLASVPLGWFMVHIIFGFHYANVYYSPPRGHEPAGGLSFPGGGEPRAWDFLYFAFVVAMTAQVSDVSVVSTRLRRLTLAHGVISFFFNTVILAIAVNVTVGLVGR
jgi:uncharacterized membrane protein